MLSPHAASRTSASLRMPRILPSLDRSESRPPRGPWPLGPNSSPVVAAAANSAPRLAVTGPGPDHPCARSQTGGWCGGCCSPPQPPSQGVTMRIASSTGLSLLAVAALAGAAGADRTKLVRHPAPIANEYIVVMKSGLAAHAIDTSVDRLVASHRLAVRQRFGAALHGFSVSLTEADALRLAADPDVEYI